jgi:hypothetical protein
MALLRWQLAAALLAVAAHAAYDCGAGYAGVADAATSLVADFDVNCEPSVPAAAPPPCFRRAASLRRRRAAAPHRSAAAVPPSPRQRCLRAATMVSRSAPALRTLSNPPVRSLTPPAAQAT